MKHTSNRYSHSFRTGLRLAGLTFMVLLLAACASAPKKESLTVSVQATADVNPDLQGRPSPIIVHIMELKSAELFNSLDYMGLTNASGTGLGADLVGRSQLVLSPGELRQLPLELDAATTHIGLVAGYRNIDNATWRQVVPIMQGKSRSVSVNLSQAQLTATVQ